MDDREPGRCLAANSKSDWLAHWSLWTSVAIKPVKLPALTLGCCEDSHFALGRSLRIDSFVPLLQSYAALPQS